MDPNACFRELCEALDARRDAEAAEAASNLLVWALKGGALPEVASTEALSTALAQWQDRIEDAAQLRVDVIGGKHGSFFPKRGR